METSIEFFLSLVAMARILVVFLRIHRKSRRKRQAKACDRSVQPVVYRTLAKTSDEWLSRIRFILIELTMTGQSRTTTSRRKRTLYLELRMRGEMKLTYKTFLLNGETSDTNDNVKTKTQST